MSDFFKNTADGFRNSGTLVKLLIINIGLFLIVNLVHNLSPFDLSDYLALPSWPSLFVVRFWTLFSYMFMHFEIGHILNNMIWLFFMGQLFNVILGNQRMLFVYVMGGLCGGILFMLLGNIFPQLGGRLVGASAAVMAISVTCGFYMPNMLVNVMFIGEVRLKWVVLVSFILSSVIDISSNTGGKIAHLGGALFGMIYALQLKKGNDIASGFTSLFKRKNKLKVVHKKAVSDDVYNATKADEQRMLDEILDKINRSGYESLSKRDKENLHRLSQKK